MFTRGWKMMKFPQSTVSATPTSLATEPSTKESSRKKLYIIVAAVIAIAIIVAALLFIPQSNADVIPLGVHYSAGEKLTYALTTQLSTDATGISTSVSSNGTVTIDVVSFDGVTYTLNYTTTSSMLGYSITTSKIIQVNDSQIVTTLALLPVALQQFASIGNDTGPLMTGFFNQTQAKVGDTWNIPLSSMNSSTGQTGELTLTFRAIQDLTVQAGSYKVFRIDFSTSTQGSQSNLNALTLQLSGQSYLEVGTCKQIQSTLQMNMTSELGNTNYNLEYTITSTLKADSEP
jgi:hypothetical protein